MPQDTAAAAWLVLVLALAGASAAFFLRLLPRAGITPETVPVATVPELLSKEAGDAGCTTLMAGAGPLAALAIPGAARAAAVATAAAAPAVSKVRIFTWISPLTQPRPAQAPAIGQRFPQAQPLRIKVVLIVIFLLLNGPVVTLAASP